MKFISESFVMWFNVKYHLVVDWEHAIVDYQCNYRMHNRRLNYPTNLNKCCVHLIHDESTYVFLDNESNQSDQINEIYEYI